MDKLSKTVFTVIIAVLLICSIRMFAQVRFQVREAEATLSRLRMQAEELRGENYLLRDSLRRPGESLQGG